MTWQKWLTIAIYHLCSVKMVDWLYSCIDENHYCWYNGLLSVCGVLVRCIWLLCLLKCIYMLSSAVNEPKWGFPHLYPMLPPCPSVCPECTQQCCSELHALPAGELQSFACGSRMQFKLQDGLLVTLWWSLRKNRKDSCHLETSVALSGIWAVSEGTPKSTR